MVNAFDIKTDLSEELAIVRALIAENGNPALTEEVLREAEAAQTAPEKMIVRADHTNGYVKAAFGCEKSEMVERVKAMVAAGYWTNITIQPFVPMKRKKAAS